MRLGLGLGVGLGVGFGFGFRFGFGFGLGLGLGLGFGLGFGLGLVHALATMAAWLRLPVGGATWGEAWRTPLHMHPAAPPADAPARRCSSATEGGALGMGES